MIIVGALLAFWFGWYCCCAWGNHRAKYYKKQLDKATVFCDTMRDTIEILTKKLERLNRLGVHEDENSFECKFERGVLRGIADVQGAAMRGIH